MVLFLPIGRDVSVLPVYYGVFVGIICLFPCSTCAIVTCQMKTITYLLTCLLTYLVTVVRMSAVFHASLCLSVCSSVCHALALCQNDTSQHHTEKMILNQ